MRDEKVDQVLKEVWLDIADRYQVEFLEIGMDKDQVHCIPRIVCLSACDDLAGPETDSTDCSN